LNEEQMSVNAIQNIGKKPKQKWKIDLIL
jgi:hypothetical protein